MTISDLNETEYIPYFKGYIDNAKGLKLLPGLLSSYNEAIDFYLSIDANKLSYRYAEGKWTIKGLFVI